MRRLFSDTRGATAIEYALIACLISVAAMAGYQSLGHSVNSLFGGVETAMDPQPAP